MYKRALRKQRDSRIVARRLKLLRANDDQHTDLSGKTYYGKLVKQQNRLKKKHPYDCGNSNCHICHLEKVLHKKSARDKRLDQIACNELKSQQKNT